MHVVALTDAVDFAGFAEGLLVAGSRRVDEVLDDGGVHHCKGRYEEADGDACDGLEEDAAAAEEGVDDAVEDGEGDDDGDGVEVLHQVVGDTVARHLTGCKAIRKSSHQEGRKATYLERQSWMRTGHK